jgi:3-methyl-2-oxobutanoate hydroxymethyltransferase
MYKSSARGNRPVTVPELREFKRRGEKIAVLTAYDASFAALLDAQHVDAVLVGDSLGMVVQGHDSTLPVSVDDVVYHCAAVARGLRRALLIADMPFLSYPDAATALRHAHRLLAEGGARMVKLEGAGHVVEVIRHLVERDVPVCAHLGLTPQSVHRLGGYRVQGRDADAAARLVADAHAVAAAGAELLVLECVPAKLAERVTLELGIATIGIGAGPHCDGQVLVLHDMLGITPGRRPKFSRDFLAGRESVAAAVAEYVAAVKDGRFPAPEHVLA